MATRKRQISNIFALILMIFAAFCLQAHLTPRFTPQFASLVSASIAPLNTQVFSPLGLTDEQLNYAFAGVNVLNLVTLLAPSTRKVGFMVNFIFYMIGMVATAQIGESPFVHIALVWFSLLGFIFRDDVPL